MNTFQLLKALEMELVKFDLYDTKTGFEFRFAVKACLIAIKNLKVFF